MVVESLINLLDGSKEAAKFVSEFANETQLATDVIKMVGARRDNIFEELVESILVDKLTTQDVQQYLELLMQTPNAGYMM